jgi:hypothetical protein
VDFFGASSVAYRYYDEMGQLKCKVATDCHSSKPEELFLTTEKRRKRRKLCAPAKKQSQALRKILLTVKSTNMITPSRTLSVKFSENDFYVLEKNNTCSLVRI